MLEKAVKQTKIRIERQKGFKFSMTKMRQNLGEECAERKTRTDNAYMKKMGWWIDKLVKSKMERGEEAREENEERERERE